MIDTLLRLELLNARAFWRTAARDGLFMFAVVAGLLVAIACLLRVQTLATQGMPPALVFIASGVAGAVAFAGLYPNARSRALAVLVDGPLFPLIADRKALSQWFAVRTGLVAAPVVLFAALVFAVRSPLGGVGFFAAALAGELLAALFWMRPPPPAAGPATPGQRIARPPMSPLARNACAAAILALGALAAATAAHNNDSPAIGIALATAAAMAGAVILGPSGSVTAFAGREPPALWSVFARLHARALGFALLGGMGCGLVARLGVAGAVEIGFDAAALSALYFAFQFLHRMIRSQRNAALSLSGDASGALMVAAVQTSLGVIWLIVRAFFLIRAARRRRWLDR